MLPNPITDPTEIADTLPKFVNSIVQVTTSSPDSKVRFSICGRLREDYSDKSNPRFLILLSPHGIVTFPLNKVIRIGEGYRKFLEIDVRTN